MADEQSMAKADLESSFKSAERRKTGHNPLKLSKYFSLKGEIKSSRRFQCKFGNPYKYHFSRFQFPNKDARNARFRSQIVATMPSDRHCDKEIIVAIHADYAKFVFVCENLRIEVKLDPSTISYFNSFFTLSHCRDFLSQVFIRH